MRVVPKDKICLRIFKNTITEFINNRIDIVIHLLYVIVLHNVQISFGILPSFFVMYVVFSNCSGSVIHDIFTHNFVEILLYNMLQYFGHFICHVMRYHLLSSIILAIIIFVEYFSQCILGFRLVDFLNSKCIHVWNGGSSETYVYQNVPHLSSVCWQNAICNKMGHMIIMHQ